MIDLINNNKAKIEQLCVEFGVSKLEVFGSAATGDFDPESSDIDFIVEFDLSNSSQGLLSRYLGLVRELENMLGFKIDLLTSRSIRNPYFAKTVNESREFVYAA